MPVYDFECKKCGWVGELMNVRYEKRDTQPCPKCWETLGGPIPAFRSVGKSAYQMGAVLENGAHLKGHFGKDAKRSRK